MRSTFTPSRVAPARTVSGAEALRYDALLLEGLTFGLGVPPSSARRPARMADGACLEHPEVEFIPSQPATEQNADDARAICSRACAETSASPTRWPTHRSSASGRDHDG